MKTLHNRCAGLDVHKAEVVACLRVANRGKARSFRQDFVDWTSMRSCGNGERSIGAKYTAPSDAAAVLCDEGFGR